MEIAPADQTDVCPHCLSISEMPMKYCRRSTSNAFGLQFGTVRLIVPVHPSFLTRYVMLAIERKNWEGSLSTTSGCYE